MNSLILHATTVALDGRALILAGASGSGKSSLALELISRGCALVADDRTKVDVENGALVVRAPTAIAGWIEVRGLGILNATVTDQAHPVAYVDLDSVERQRLPPPRTKDVLGHPLRLFHKIESPVFPAALLQYLRLGEAET
ncbi:HPr kinase/phosphorylase [Anianabacter salinae]|uniref:HPr kinase/phosphorylase n=1 Tax=Anianabacter salinae TaxID=2851023 RepID=UPI00225DEE8E|nr:HPr kinase/phosphatase C-terminal domain-containing protein [Anianabacter salinae]MBV0913191.1 HPr kinase/phosphatase C-terminal domain-containing protein [Anianabacter salinae]